jgi:lipopolysaccharide assembly protein A
MKSRVDQSPNPGAGSYRGERQTRLSAIWMAIAVAVVALAAVLVFILQNPREVDLTFLLFHGRLPLAIALLFAVLLGAVIVLASGAARILQLRGVARRARRAQSDASPADDS